jgi:hypothetical protein
VSFDGAAVEWWAVVTSASGDVETLAGVSLLRFAADGRVAEQRDVWASGSGHVAMPHWAR